ncbi:MAG: HAMP domain-containing histidine kinase, partial [Thermogutta sp.]|nr:HAMP domain-containing histidine kinase [Thermogutta sp.]
MDRLALAEHLFLGRAELSDEVRLGLADALLAWASRPAGGHDAPRTVAEWRRSLVRLQRRDPRLYPILIRLVEPAGEGPCGFAGIAARLWASLPELLPQSAPPDVPPSPGPIIRTDAARAEAEPNGPAKGIGPGSRRPRPAEIALRTVLWAEELAAAWARENARTAVPLARAACIVSALADGIMPDPALPNASPNGAASLREGGKRGRRPRPTDADGRSPSLERSRSPWQAQLEHWERDEPGRSALQAAAIGWEIAARLWESLPGAAATGRGTPRRSRKSLRSDRAGAAIMGCMADESGIADRIRAAAAEWVAALGSPAPHPVRPALARAERLFRRLRRRIPHAGDMPARVTRTAARLHALEANFAETLEQAKLDALAEFAAGAGHEINNPLAIIGGHAQVLLRSAQDPEQRRILAAITAQVRRAHEMIADARLFARPSQPSLTLIDLRDVVMQVEPSLRELAERYGTALNCELPTERVEVQADPVQLAAAFTALGKNAVEAAAEGGRVSLALHAR